MKEKKFTPLPKDTNGKIDLVQLKQLYMSSAHLQWTSFCQEFGYDPSASKKFPFKVWKLEKKERLALIASGNIIDTLAVGMHKWQIGVLKMLEAYPETIEMLHEMVTKKASELQQKAVEDVTAEELYVLAKAAKAVMDAKLGSLMIKNMSYLDLKEFLGANSPNQNSDDGRWEIDIIDKKPLSGDQFSKILSKWYDQPQSQT